MRHLDPHQTRLQTFQAGVRHPLVGRTVKRAKAILCSRTCPCFVSNLALVEPLVNPRFNTGVESILSLALFEHTFRKMSRILDFRISIVRSSIVWRIILLIIEESRSLPNSVTCCTARYLKMDKIDRKKKKKNVSFGKIWGERWIGVSNGIISLLEMFLPSFLPSLVTHREHGFSPDTSGLSVSRSTAGARSIEGDHSADSSARVNFSRFVSRRQICARTCVSHMRDTRLGWGSIGNNDDIAETMENKGKSVVELNDSCLTFDRGMSLLYEAKGTRWFCVFIYFRSPG